MFFSRAYTNHLERLERWNGVVFIGEFLLVVWNAAGTLLERNHEDKKPARIHATGNCVHR